ncbi:unnamed protein product [Toxocara canis]|uniref:Uncharacterized protein n=1 Tax=Toxocara canis TaxID=6265 RepID=A0A183U904_TOXCA|nr:unnamed protein product [Toxocara canis]
MNREDGKPSTSFTAQRRLSPPPESMRARSSSTTAIHRSKKSAPRGEHDTQSQQVNLESPTRSGLMKRALSFQVSGIFYWSRGCVM